MANLVDAAQMNKEHPGTFFIPDLSEISLIEPGTFVKIAAVMKGEGSERFWVEVKSVDGDRYTGRVDNDLVGGSEHGFAYNDIVEFKTRHIHAVY